MAAARRHGYDRPTLPNMNTSRKIILSCAVGGFLAASAFAQSSQPAGQPTPSARDEAPVSLTDATNASGKTSGNNTVKELRFSSVDLDSNGLISLTEFTTFMDPQNTQRSAATADGATVNPVELLFRQIDKDSDNYLSEKEVTAYQQEQDRANGVTR